MSTDDTNAARRGSGSNEQLGMVVDAAVIDCWKVNYGLAKTPSEIAAMWGNWAPTGAILALRAAVAEIERLRAMLAAERERCAKLCDEVDAEHPYADSYFGQGCMACKRKISAPPAAPMKGKK